MSRTRKLTIHSWTAEPGLRTLLSDNSWGATEVERQVLGFLAGKHKSNPPVGG